MVTHAQPRLGLEPLVTQIARAELQLRQRRRQVTTSGALLRQSIRGRLTSPWALLLAGGVGFVAGDFATRTRATPAAAPGNRNGSFARALSLLALVRSVVSMFPPAPTRPLESERAEHAQDTGR